MQGERKQGKIYNSFFSTLVPVNSQIIFFPNNIKSLMITNDIEENHVRQSKDLSFY